MKKFLRFYLPILIICLSLSFLFLVYMLKNHPVMVWYALGRARIHGQTVNSVVKVNGNEQINVRVFRISDDELLVYAPGSVEMYPVIIVNKTKKDIGSTNAGENYYELLFGRYLFQSDGAYGIVYASDMKWDYNPNLEITDSEISYTTHHLENDKQVDDKVEILFKGE